MGKAIPEDVAYVASPLRRAISTTLMVFQKRLGKRKVQIWDCLQEISRNVDTASITSAHEIPTCSRKEQTKFQPCGDMYLRVLDVSGFGGNKTLRRRGVERIQAFAAKCFEEPPLRPKPLVVGAHSLYFKNFFNIYLPDLAGYPNMPQPQKEVATLARTKKIQNSGIVSFTLQECESMDGTIKFYRIRPSSIREVYKGFEQDKKKK